MRPKTLHLDIDVVRSDALFASPLQMSDDPGAGQVQQAIARAVREFGGRGCAERVAQEFGDHPEAAVVRIRWARRVVCEASGAARAHARPQLRSVGRSARQRGHVAQAAVARTRRAA